MRYVYLDATPLMGELLAEVGAPPGLHVHHGDPDPATLQALLAGAELVLNGHTYMDAAVLAAAPHLREIVFLGTGAASYIDLAAAEARGIRVHTIRNYGDAAVAQHTLALALSALRGVAAMDRNLRAGHWQVLEGAEFGDLTFAIAGTGGIGMETARLAAALGFRVTAWNRSPRPLPEVVSAARDLDTLIAGADILSLHLALTPETRHLLDARRLHLMRPGAILVNTARAGLVDEAALLEALAQGRPAHAALDVFETEPLPPGHPLTRCEAVTLTAHAAYKTRAAARRLLIAALDLAALDLAAGLRG